MFNDHPFVKGTESPWKSRTKDLIRQKKAELDKIIMDFYSDADQDGQLCASLSMQSLIDFETQAFEAVDRVRV